VIWSDPSPAAIHHRRAPRVSICVPNLNTRPFLPERFASIFAQSFQDWELLVYDSYSSDGAWEYIIDTAAREPRLRAWQGPREGAPGSWTPCLQAARGEFVYIACSDDTMPPDCLEKLVHALDAHQECQIAHCPLRPIDEGGNTDVRLHDWWWNGSEFALSSGSLINTPHVRYAPFDGLLHLLGGSVYISSTQLLFRRSLFEAVGYFRGTWGSVGDFNWSMRAGLMANTVHVPETWGGWRQHGAQATAGVSFESPAHARVIDAMIDDALAAAAPRLPVPLRAELAGLARDARAFRTLTREVSIRRQRSLLVRRAFLVGQLCSGSPAAREYVTMRLLRRPSTDWIRRRWQATSNAPPLVPVACTASPEGASHRSTERHP
jgi:glycosyltransferase involved in cell wall biosynthesis